MTILYAGALLHALYRLPASRYHGLRVYSNTPPNGAMRGHGSVDVRHAFESMLDRMAGELGLDPFAVRRANLLPVPHRTANDLQVNSCGLAECLDLVERASGWRERRGTLPRGRGLGMACSHYVSGSAKPVHWTGEPHAVVNLKLDFDGGITVLTGAADIGQGSSTLLAQAVAEVLGLPLDRLTVVANDSVVTPKDNGSYSSRVSFMVGNAAIGAARELRRVLVAAAARKLEAAGEDIECLGEAYRVAGTDRMLGYKDVVAAALEDNGTLTVKGTWSTPPETQGGKFKGAAVGTSAGFSYAAQVVEVAVDEDTGMVHVERVWVAHDCGRAINPLAVEGQIQGSVWMGMGQALSEETQYHEGLPLRANLLDYRVPTIVESPPIETFIVEAADPNGPFGAKEAGEGSLSGFLPALTNAIADATGLRLTELPASPDRLLEALVARRRCGAPAQDGRQPSPSRPGTDMDGMAPFTLARPATLVEAALLLATDKRARVLAGGTDLLPNLRHGIGAVSVLVDLGGIAGLGAIDVTTDGTTIGAGVTLARLLSDAKLMRALPILGEAALSIAGPGHRTIATIGGNLCLDTRCVFYNQSAWWRARQRLLPEARRRDVPRRTAGAPLSCGVLRRSCAGPARSRRRRRDCRPARDPTDAARRALCRRRRRASDARTRRHRGRRSRAATAGACAMPVTARRARAAPSISRWRAWRRASGSATAWWRSSTSR